MKFEIPGQFRGPECSALIKPSTDIRRELEPLFEDVKARNYSKLSLILRVGGSLGEFEKKVGDGQPRNERNVVVCDVLIRDCDWKSRSPEEIRSILAAHLVSPIEECCRYLGLGPEFVNLVLKQLAQQGAQDRRAEDSARLS